TVRYQTLTSNKIPQDLNNTKILYVSDIYYGNHMNQSRLQKLVDTINRIAPDAVVFGGDIYAPNATISTDSDGEIATALTSIKAPLGKFAVLGDQDCATADIKSHVLSILQTSNFEV
ncbi:MAG: metallophosphoesterase, partial [Solobacterium sp.]|nr:metallophosphoesterase [Solobacterium sp.]